VNIPVLNNMKICQNAAADLFKMQECLSERRKRMLIL